MRKIYETAVILIGTLGWWGFVYPELCLTQDLFLRQDAYEQESEAESNGQEDENVQGKDIQEQKDDQEGNFWEDGFKIGELRIKSRPEKKG